MAHVKCRDYFLLLLSIIYYVHKPWSSIPLPLAGPGPHCGWDMVCLRWFTRHDTSLCSPLTLKTSPLWGVLWRSSTVRRANGGFLRFNTSQGFFTACNDIKKKKKSLGCLFSITLQNWNNINNLAFYLLVLNLVHHFGLFIVSSYSTPL